MGSPKESLEKKIIFAEKYDEIRRLDGTRDRSLKSFPSCCSQSPLLIDFTPPLGKSGLKLV